MASRRALLRLSLRSAVPAVSRQQFPLRQASISSPLRNAVTQYQPVCRAASQLRWHSSSSSKSNVYDFNRVKQLLESPSSERILIDVREPHEYNAGFIPTAINIPIASQPDALFMPPDEFEDQFGFIKPPMNKELVFYCKAGVRSSAAAQLAQQHGYENVAEYRGSWLDWEKNGGETSKDPKGSSGGESNI